MSQAVSKSLVIADYDPCWPQLFAEEKARLDEAIGQWTAAIEHVGSTAVPGLAAKPVIDIGVSLHSFRDALLCITPLVQLGYRCMGEFGIPGRVFFRKVTDTPLPGQTFDGVARTHQVHMYEEGHWEDVAHILFRDWLRARPETVRKYEALKRELAAKHSDVNAYAEAKSEFIRGVVTQARRASRAPITIAEYDPRWPEGYDAEKKRLLAELGPRVTRIEHIGSTAVPGLAAKPVIDIMPGVPALVDAEKCIEGMQRLGYEHGVDDTLPERLYFRKGHPERKLQVHIVEDGGEFWRSHVAFRDHLRAHPDVAAEYAALKRQLAAKHPRDVLAYTDAKSDFIRGIERKAAAAAPSPSSPGAKRGASATQ